MPSSSTSGWSSETSRLKMGFSQMDKPDAVAVLQRERRLLVGEAELLGARPDCDDVGRRRAGLHQRDGLVHVLAAAHVGVALRGRRAADREAAVVAGAVAQVAVQDVEERRVAGADQPVAVDVRMRRAALAGDRVDALDVLAAEVVEHLADQADALVLADARAEERVQLLVGGVDHRAGLGQQADLVGCLDPPGVEEDLLPVDDVEALGAAARRGSASR